MVRQTVQSKRQKTKPAELQERWSWWRALVIWGMAVLVRVIYLIQARQNDPLFFAPQMDGLYHHQWALAIVSGREFIADAYFRAPLYPFSLALLYKVFGVNLFLTRLAQAVLGSSSCVLLYLTGRRIFDERSGFYAGLVMAVYPLVVYFDGELLIPVLLIFLLLGGMFFLYLSETKPVFLVFAGFFFGLAAISRPNVLVFVGVLFFWFVFKYRRGWWQRVLPFYLMVSLPIVPVTVRNYVKSKSFVPIAWQGGTNFYIGNNEYSDGTTAIVPGTRGSWWGGYNDVKVMAEQESGRSLKGVEIDRFYLKKGLEFWRQKPGRAIELTLRKIYLWFAGYEVSNNRDLYFFKRYSYLNFLLFSTPVLKFPFGVLLPLALCGIYLTRERWQKLLPVYLFLCAWTVSFIPFFVTARYRLPLVPFYILFAVAGAGIWLRVSKRERLIATGIFILTLILFNLNIAGSGRTTDQAQNYFVAGSGYYETGRLQEAEADVNRALALDSATNILSLKASILLAKNRLPEAVEIARAALRLHPDEADAWGVAGNVLATAGDLTGAESLFQRAVELDPYSFEGWNNLGNIALTKGELKQAKGYYERALRINPVFSLALFHLGLVHYYEGRIDSAHVLWQRVLVLDPNFEKAKRALQELR
jgi:4-amino-4-deoxy-L-arabinose transferase-like glycosyltransferase/predicted TPR repeat methyltransferase